VTASAAERLCSGATVLADGGHHVVDLADLVM
jgi:hypothetical protein